VTAKRSPSTESKTYNQIRSGRPKKQRVKSNFDDPSEELDIQSYDQELTELSRLLDA
jgi:hypothetical protein